MPDTVGLVYVGPHEAVYVDDPDTFERHTVERGDTCHVPAALAGRAPSGDPGDDGYDPGEGLLAQPANWQPAAARTAAVRQARAQRKAADQADETGTAQADTDEGN